MSAVVVVVLGRKRRVNPNPSFPFQFPHAYGDQMMTKWTPIKIYKKTR